MKGNQMEWVEGVDYVVLTEADVEMMRHAVTAGAEDVDFSEWYDFDPTGTPADPNVSSFERVVDIDFDERPLTQVRMVPAPEDIDW